MTVELKHLTYIVAAANHQSFRKAAESLRVKQSTLSRAIQLIERRLNVSLFERSSRGVRTTPAGAIFVRGAELAIQTIKDIVSGAKAIGRGEAGRLAIGCSGSGINSRFSAALRAYREKGLDVELTIHEGDRSRLLALLGSGVIDVAMVVGGGDEGFAAVPAWADRIVVVLPETHHLADRMSLFWTDLIGEVVMTSRQDPGREIESLLRSKLAGAGMIPALRRHDATPTTLQHLVAMGYGLALIGESYLEDRGGIVAREISDGIGPSVIFHSAVFRRHDHSEALHSFLTQFHFLPTGNFETRLTQIHI